MLASSPQTAIAARRPPITDFVSEVALSTCTFHVTSGEDFCLSDAYSFSLFLSFSLFDHTHYEPPSLVPRSRTLKQRLADRRARAPAAERTIRCLQVYNTNGVGMAGISTSRTDALAIMLHTSPGTRISCSRAVYAADSSFEDSWDRVNSSRSITYGIHSPQARTSESLKAYHAQHGSQSDAAWTHTDSLGGLQESVVEGFLQYYNTTC